MSDFMAFNVTLTLDVNPRTRLHCAILLVHGEIHHKSHSLFLWWATCVVKIIVIKVHRDPKNKQK